MTTDFIKIIIYISVVLGHSVVMTESKLIKMLLKINVMVSTDMFIFLCTLD